MEMFDLHHCGKAVHCMQNRPQYIILSLIFHFISDKVNRYVKIFTDIYTCI